MSRHICTLSLVIGCLPGIAFAIPPRSHEKPKQGGQQQRQGHAINPGNPSLSPARNPAGPRPGGAGNNPAARRGQKAPGNPAANAHNPNLQSMLASGDRNRNQAGGPGMGPRPGMPSNRPSLVAGQTGLRPNPANNSGIRPNPAGPQRPDARPAQRPDITFHRPGDQGNRPGGQGNRPDANDWRAGMNNRPDFADRRPAINRPDIDNRPDINRPTINNPVVNRPDVAINRPGINNPDVTVNRPVVVNRPITNIDNTVINNNRVNNNAVIRQNNVINRNVVNQQINNNRNANYPAYARRVPNYYSSLHYQWQPTTSWTNYRPMYSNYYSNSTGYSNNWMGSGVASYAYTNPFYTAASAATAATAVNQVYDYSQPIHVPTADYQETNDDLVNSEQAIRRFDDARELFRRGEYGRANDVIDEAVKLLPSDPTLHQLRGLILFARQRYPEASAAVYSVLAVSSGWDLDTVTKLYDDPERYQEQLNDLQSYAETHPDATAAQFLLAYHATIVGELRVAETNLGLVYTANPNDELVKNLLISIQRANN